MKYIHFELTYYCNYKCEYCVQNEMKKNFPPELMSASDAVVDGFINFVQNTKEKCDISLLGGEIFVHKRVFDIIEAILKNGHILRITSNFSFPLEYYKRILEINENGQVFFNLSLHLSQTSQKDFFEKLEHFVPLIQDDSHYSYCVCSVVKEDNFEILKDFNEKLKNKFGQEMLFQNLIENGQEVFYNKEIEDFLKKGESKDGNFEKKYIKPYERTFGTMCYSGCKWVLITPQGCVRRCLNPNQKGLSVLGNIASGNVNFLKTDMPCMSDKCLCSISLSLGLIQFGKKNIFKTIYCIIKHDWIFNLKNFIFSTFKKIYKKGKKFYNKKIKVFIARLSGSAGKIIKKIRKHIINFKRKIFNKEKI